MATNSTTDKRIPTTVLTGFLGSGKTTLLNYVLKSNHGKKIAVIENEFGEIGVDDALVVDAEEEVFEMNNGCICCTVRGDLIRILGNLAKRKNKFDYILIETTGLADPGPIAQTFFVADEVKDHFRLDGIVTLVDCKHLLLHLDEVKPEGVENESLEQLAFADRIILNKTDLVTAEEVAKIEDRVKSVNKFAPIARSEFSKIDLDFILNVKSFELTRVLDFDPAFLEDAEHKHDATISSVGIQDNDALDPNKTQNWLGKLMREKGADIFRSKGVLNFNGENSQVVFQAVHMLLSFQEGKEWSPTDIRFNRLIFIGRNLDRASLLKSFEECKIKKK